MPSKPTIDMSRGTETPAARTREDGFQKPDRHFVGRGEQRRRPVLRLAAQHRLGSRHAGREIVIARPFEAFGRRQRVAKAHAARGIEMATRPARQIGDALVAEPDQMFDRVARGGAVVDLDLRELGAANTLAHRDDRQARIEHRAYRPFGHIAVQQQHAVDLAGGGEVDIALLVVGRIVPRRVQVEIGDDEAVAAPREGRIDAAQQLTEIGVADIRHHDQRHVAAPCTQIPRRDIGRVAQTFGRRDDARARGRFDHAGLGEGAADRRDRNAGDTGDVGDLRGLDPAGGFVFRGHTGDGLWPGSPGLTSAPCTALAHAPTTRISCT
jgi:hypothetical protein